MTEDLAHDLLVKIKGVSFRDDRYRLRIGGPGDVLLDWEQRLNAEGGRDLGDDAIHALREVKDSIEAALEYLETWEGNIGLSAKECRAALAIMSERYQVEDRRNYIADEGHVTWFRLFDRDRGALVGDCYFSALGWDRSKSDCIAAAVEAMHAREQRTKDE